MAGCRLAGRKMLHRMKIFCGFIGLLFLFSASDIFDVFVPDGGLEGKEEKEVSGGTDGAGGQAPAVRQADSGRLAEPPKVAITFDDGPNASCTGRLLDGLKERGVKATFFLIGENAEENPGLVKRISGEGHVIGNHTYHHVDITQLSDEEARYEIEETDKVIYGITGEHVRYVRPPFGVWQEELEFKMEALPVMWSVDTLDT